MIRRIFIILFFFSFVTLCQSLPSNTHSLSAFIENKGQIIDQNNKPNPGVLYLLNTPGFNVQLRRGGFSYDLYTATGLKPQASRSNLKADTCSLQPEACGLTYHRIDITLEGSNPECQIIPSDPLPDYFNYFTANIPETGIKNVRQYKNITYKNIYPGIDLEFFINKEHGYKYNFVIHPGANIKDIRLRIDGPDNISLNRDTLKFRTRFGDVEELIPESYYIVNDSRVDIRVRFKKINNDVYGFSSDETIPENSVLVIDPTTIRLWGTYYGGTGFEGGIQCSTDIAGNVFLAGSTTSLNNIASTGSYQDTLAGNFDGFLAKFDAAGQRQWGTYFGGTGFDEGSSCIVYKSGNIYVSGDTKSTSGIASPGAHQTVYGGGTIDCFIEKFNQAGDRLWGTYYGGVQDDFGGYVGVDKNGNVFLTGSSLSDTGIATSGAYQQNRYNFTPDAFLAKFDSNGVRQWGTYYGGELDDDGEACSSDSLGNVYFAGETASYNNIASPGTNQTTYGGGIFDAFLVKFTTGGQRVWATYYGGSLDDRGFGCTADSAGNVCLVGETNSLNGIASPGCHQPVFGGGLYDAFIVKFDSMGQRFWGTYYGGTDYDEAFGCTFGWNNYIFLVGEAASSNNISTPDSYQPVLEGSGDAFLVKINADGQRQWGTYYGGNGPNDSFINCIYVPDDTLYLAGQTNSTYNIASQGAWQEVFGGIWDDMLIKFLDCWPIDTAGPISGLINVCMPSNDVSYSIPPLAHSINYIWTLPPGATIESGDGTATITVNFSGSATSGNICVKGVNKCGNPGDSSCLFVTPHLPPVPLISGPDTTCAGPGKIYSTASGMTNYQWSVSPGGVISSGGSTTDDTTTITWNVAGTQHVYLSYTDNGCDALTPLVFDVWVTPSPAVDITITTSANNVCQGTLVTFTAIPTNGGSSPAFQWKVNGINVGTNDSTYTYTPVNSDTVICILSSNATCTSNNPASSNQVIMAIDSNLIVSVSVGASANPVCAGTPVTFTAIPVNGGNSPSYQWKVNGINVGTSSPFYSYTPLNGDSVICVLTSSEVCTSDNPFTSSPVIMVIDSNLPVSVSISASANPVCSGIAVTYTATPANEGSSPLYQWKVNGVNVGTNSSMYTYNPASGDQILCILTSNIACPIGNPATSNIITMNVGASPVVTFIACFDTITATNAKPIELKGGIPLGGIYSGPGVNPATGIFNPAAAGTGNKTITYTYTNVALCSASATIHIFNFPFSIFSCGNPLTDIRDNKTYQTVQIGSQCWMAENLNYGTMIPGTMNQRDNCINEKYCWNDLTANCELGTANYQWDELMQYDDTPGQQGFCPPGWHIPTEADWAQLFSVFNGPGFAASPLLSTGFSGFNAIVNGSRFQNSGWYFNGFATHFWASSSWGPIKAWAHGMNNIPYDHSVSTYPSSRVNAFSVRCLKD